MARLLKSRLRATETQLTTTSASTYAMTSFSPGTQIFEGTTPGQIVRLPNAQDLEIGTTFEIWNLSETALTIEDSTGVELLEINPESYCKVILKGSASEAGTWLVSYGLDFGLASDVDQAATRQVMFQFMGQMNFNQYLVTGPHIVSSGFRRSGDASNGARFTNSAPAMSPINGFVTAVSTNATGIAQSTGAAAPIVTLRLELWKVGQSGGEGTKLGDIAVPIDSSTYNIGNWFDSSIVTAFGQEDLLDPGIPVEAGDLLGLKFISMTGNANVVSVHNLTIMLAISRA